MAAAGSRIGVIGATGALGQAVLAALARSSLRIAEIYPVATEASLGEEIEFGGEDYPVVVPESGVDEPVSLRGLDLALLCAPPGASLDFARAALRAEVPCIDLSGALVGSPEVPLRVADLAGSESPAGLPLVASPAGAALPWSLVLSPLKQAAGLRRVVGTIFEAASAAGVAGIEALHLESVALFNQQEPPDPAVFPGPVAFDCMPAVGEVDAEGVSDRERNVTHALTRLLGDELRVFATAVQVPAFVGQGTSLTVETERPLEVKEVLEVLAAAPFVEPWNGGADGPSLRAAAGREHVLVGRVRRDPSHENSIALWLASDLLSLTAANAVRLAVARLNLH